MYSALDILRRKRTSQHELEKHPEDAFLHYLVAEILQQKGAIPNTSEFRQAIGEGEQAVKLRSNFVLAHDLLAGLYLKSNQIELAKLHARETLRLQPTAQVALYHLIQALRNSVDTDSGEAFATTRNRHRHQLAHDCKVVGRSVLGGLHHEYRLERIAA
jgi:tetratricopeptide (TPR) repeat protein